MSAVKRIISVVAKCSFVTKISDAGYGWVHARFAKPLPSGSIPARVSIYIDSLGADPPMMRHYKGQRMFWLGRMVALWVLRTPAGYRSFRAGLLYPIETVNCIQCLKMHNVPELTKAVRREREEKEAALRYLPDLVASRKELSKLKRKIAQYEEQSRLGK